MGVLFVPLAQCFWLLAVLLFPAHHCGALSRLSRMQQICKRPFAVGCHGRAAFLRAPVQQPLFQGSLIPQGGFGSGVSENVSNQVSFDLLKIVPVINGKHTQAKRHSFAMWAENDAVRGSRREVAHTEMNNGAVAFSSSETSLISDIDNDLFLERQKVHMRHQETFHEQLVPLIDPKENEQAEQSLPSEADGISIKGTDFALKTLLPLLQQPTEELQETELQELQEAIDRRETSNGHEELRKEASFSASSKGEAWWLSAETAQDYAQEGFNCFDLTNSEETLDLESVTACVVRLVREAGALQGNRRLDAFASGVASLCRFESTVRKSSFGGRVQNQHSTLRISFSDRLWDQVADSAVKLRSAWKAGLAAAYACIWAGARGFLRRGKTCISSNEVTKDMLPSEEQLLKLEETLLKAAMNPLVLWMGAREAAAASKSTASPLSQTNVKAPRFCGSETVAFPKEVASSLFANAVLSAALLPPRGGRSVSWQEQDESLFSMLLALQRQTDTVLDRHWFEQVLKQHTAVRLMKSTSVQRSRKLFFSSDPPEGSMPPPAVVVDRLILFASAIAAAEAYAKNLSPSDERRGAAAARQACSEVALDLAGTLKVPEGLIQKRQKQLMSVVLESLALRVADLSSPSSAVDALHHASQTLGTDAFCLRSAIRFAAALSRQRIVAPALHALEQVLASRKEETQDPAFYSTGSEGVCSTLPLKAACENALQSLRLVTSTTKGFLGTSSLSPESGAVKKHGGDDGNAIEPMSIEGLSSSLKKLLMRLAVALFSQVVHADAKALPRARDFCLEGFQQIITFFSNEDSFTAKGTLNVKGVEALLEILQCGGLEATAMLRQQLAVSVPMENRGKAIGCAERLSVLDEIFESLVKAVASAFTNRLSETPQLVLLRYLRGTSLLGMASDEAAAEALGDFGLHSQLELQPLRSEMRREERQEKKDAERGKQAFAALLDRLAALQTVRTSQDVKDVVDMYQAETVFAWMASEQSGGASHEERDQRNRWCERWRIINGISRSRAVELREEVLERFLETKLDALRKELVRIPERQKKSSINLGGLSSWVGTLKTLEQPPDADRVAARINITEEPLGSHEEAAFSERRRLLLALRSALGLSSDDVSAIHAEAYGEWFRVMVEDAARHAADYADSPSSRKEFCVTTENLEFQKQQVDISAKKGASAIDVNTDTASALTRQGLIAYAAQNLLPPLIRAVRSCRLAQFGSVVFEAGSELKRPVTAVQGGASIAMPDVLSKIMSEDLAFNAGLANQMGVNSKCLFAPEDMSPFQNPLGLFDDVPEALRSLYMTFLLQRRDMQAAEEFLRMTQVAVEDQSDVEKQPTKNAGSEARRRTAMRARSGNPLSLAGDPGASGDIRRSEGDNSFKSEMASADSLTSVVVLVGDGKAAGNLLRHLSALGAFCRVHDLVKEKTSDSTDFRSWLGDARVGATSEFINSLNRSLPENAFSVVLEEALLILMSYSSESATDKSPMEKADLRRGLAALAEFAYAVTSARQKALSNSRGMLDSSAKFPHASGQHVDSGEGPALAHVAAGACFRRMELIAFEASRAVAALLHELLNVNDSTTIQRTSIKLSERIDSILRKLGVRLRLLLEICGDICIRTPAERNEFVQRAVEFTRRNAFRMFMKSLTRVIEAMESQTPASSSNNVAKEGSTWDISARFGVTKALATAVKVLGLSRWQDKLTLDDATKLTMLRHECRFIFKTVIDEGMQMTSQSRVLSPADQRALSAKVAASSVASALKQIDMSPFEAQTAIEEVLNSAIAFQDKKAADELHGGSPSAAATAAGALVSLLRLRETLVEEGVRVTKKSAVKVTPEQARRLVLLLEAVPSRKCESQNIERKLLLQYASKH